MLKVLTHVKELIGVVPDPPGRHTNHIDQCRKSDPAPRYISLPFNRWIDIGFIDLLSVHAHNFDTHIDTSSDMNSAGENDESRTPTMQDLSLRGR
jgi:hypothetical protein